MNESEFNDLVDDIFVEIEDAIEDACDATNADIDYETSAGILSLSFENGTQIILNRQTPLKQIWVAAKQGGFHFDFNAETNDWLCDGKELFAALSDYCTDQAGKKIALEKP